MTLNMKSLLVTVIILFTDGVVIAGPAHGSTVPKVNTPQNVHESLANEYLVQFHDDPDLSHERFMAHTAVIHAAAQKYLTGGNQYAGVIRHFSIGPGFRAFHGHLDPEHVEQLRQLNFVKRIEPNALVTTQFDSIPKLESPPTAKVQLETELRKAKRGDDLNKTVLKGPTPRSANFNVKVHVHTAENWGQSRISHRHPSSKPSYRYFKPPLPPTIYMLDTGIRKTHSEFRTSTNPSSTTNTTNSKVRFGPNFTVPPDDPLRYNSNDDNGHGTHTAGIVAGNTFGIVPHGHPVHLVAVKVLSANGSGTWDGLLQAIQWAGNDTIKRHLSSRAIINLSLGGGYSQITNDAVTAAINHAKITVVVASGNDNNLTSYLSPASCPDAITVAAIDANDTRAGFSNYGPGVDVFAPGVDILSSGNGDDDQSVYMSGTSMAAPHVAGLAAYFMMVYGAHTPDEMRQRLMGVAIKGAVKDKGEGSADAVAYNGVDDPEEDDD
ncbi:peptidase S8/S53 domain-containing protein [Apiosordaria backusii]|uniref:Peptidase S8/S53 domain-containing protein n=1 Tax=Apiosordaria backusii TaxID=314023 RepID=A0AA40EZI2_9PEZI|nr:peptidase S8/S53 domain-containing protein [Apiosordaria backusii]